MLNKLLPKGSKNRKLIKKMYYESFISSRLSKNFIHLDRNQSNKLKETYLNNFSLDSLLSSKEKDAHYNIFELMLRDHRIMIIPWIESVRRLDGLRILEIGCGNGTSTIALAEQGANVTAIDIEKSLLDDARNRCEIYNLQVDFHLMNARDVSKLLVNEKFDIIIYYAVLEHMTYEERITALKETYQMLPREGLFCVIDTPNRLHYYDSHTSLMPFYHWLPDEIAIKYSQYSPRKEFKNGLNNIPDDETKRLEFLRWGRGMSFHEFDLSIMPNNKLNIVSTLSAFLRNRSIVYCLLEMITPEYKYTSFLQKLYPEINSAFFQPYLNLIIRKE